MEKKTCLFIGRFQPYHMGHHMVVKGMTKLCDKVIIGIGSSDRSGTEENPFTAQERKEMIQEALQDEDIIPTFDINFIEIPDMDDDAEWAQTCLDLGKKVDVVWTGNEWTKECFDGKCEIKDIKEVPGISATDIRNMIKDGDADWKDKVPKAVQKAIDTLGRDRIV